MTQEQWDAIVNRQWRGLMARVESEQAARRQAERPIYDAADRLEKSIVMLASLRALIQPRLPIAEAEAEMDDTEDLIDQLQSRLGAALAIHTLEVERLQLAEDARYNAANDDAANREAA